MTQDKACVGDKMVVLETVRWPSAGCSGVIVEIEQIPHGSLMFRCMVVCPDVVAAMWFSSIEVRVLKA